MKYINGQAVPAHLPISEIAVMMESPDMKIFAIGCEALREIGTQEAYALLKQHLDPKDRYRFRYVLSVIFDFDASAELSAYFLDALQSDSFMFVLTVLKHLIHKNLWVSDEQILQCFEKNHKQIDSYYYQILEGIAKTPEYTARLIRLFRQAPSDSVRIAIAKCMTAFAVQDNYMHLFELLANSPIHKLRMEACRIACKFGRKDLLQRYVSDSDGHIRKYVHKALQS